MRTMMWLWPLLVSPPDYEDHSDLTRVRVGNSQQPVTFIADAQRRRLHTQQHVQRVMGHLPAPSSRPALEIKYGAEVRVGDLRRLHLTYQSDADDRVPAYLLLPATKPANRLPAILALHQTTAVGKDEPAGVRGDVEMQYALELAQRGYVVIVPDYPSLGEHVYDFAKHPRYASGSMKAIWDNIRAVDVLETLAEVDSNRIGVIGHSLGGHNAMFTALFEPRLKVIVSSCGFTTFHKDDVPSWNGPRYMPRIRTQFTNDAKKMPFDFPEIIAAFAPRPFLACAAEKDDDFDVGGVRACLQAAQPIYKLYQAETNLVGYYPPTKHAFPKAARQHAYEFLDGHLKK